MRSDHAAQGFPIVNIEAGQICPQNTLSFRISRSSEGSEKSWQNWRSSNDLFSVFPFFFSSSHLEEEVFYHRNLPAWFPMLVCWICTYFFFYVYFLYKYGNRVCHVHNHYQPYHVVCDLCFRLLYRHNVWKMPFFIFKNMFFKYS